MLLVDFTEKTVNLTVVVANMAPAAPIVVIDVEARAAAVVKDMEATGAIISRRRLRS